MRPPASVLAAIDAVSERVLCLSDCYSTCSVAYSPARDVVVIRHPDPTCECVVHPDGIEARALSAFVVEELSRYVAIAHYGEPLPLNVSA